MSDCIVRCTTTSAQARRLYIKKYGPLPDHIKVCHTCDNHFCLNEEHWFLGTQGDNVRDCVAKGRHHTGIGNSKLTLEQVNEIRNSNKSSTYIAFELGMTRQAINKIRSWRSWNELSKSTNRSTRRKTSVSS